LTAVLTQYTTDVETSNRTGIQLNVDTSNTTQTIGNFVTDVSIQPYIASTIVSFYAVNMRPGQTVHAFFDSVLVDQYCAPGTPAPFSVIPGVTGGYQFDTSSNAGIAKTGKWGDPLVADQYGRVFGQFNIPPGQFKTGDRVFELADTTNLTLGADALTTKATATFTASNLSVTKENVTMTTVNPSISYVPVSQTVVNTTYSNSSINLPDIVNIDVTHEPIAQGLTIVTPDGSAGVYATSIDLFFKQKSHLGNHGATLWLTEINNGYPDGTKVLPFSTVHVVDSQINVSADASVATNFAFESPIFLNNNTEYAFVLMPDGNDPDIWVYSAALGDTDIKSGIQVYSQPVTGTAFYGATTNEWTALQTEYIKFNLNIASFNVGQGDLYFNNDQTDYLTVQNITFLNANTTVLPGDIVYQSTNSTVSTANLQVFGQLTSYDNTRNILYVGQSNGGFTSNSYYQVHRFTNATVQVSPGPNTTTLIAYGNTGVIYNPVVDSIVGQFATLTPAGTSISFDYKGISNNYLADTTANFLTPGIETDMFDKERIVASFSNEQANYSNNRSLTVHAHFATDSAFISPIIDLVKKNDLVIANQVDPVSFIYNEYYNNGSSKSKYISQLVTLAAGQDSQDLQIHLTAHRSPGTDIKVYAKFLNSEDLDPITAKTWTPLYNLGSAFYNDPSNPNDVGEYIFQTYPGYGLTSTTGTITANSTLGNTVQGTGTNFGTDVQVGWWINMAANTTYSETARQVVAIQNTTSLTINAPFGTNYTTNAYYVVPPPTTAWLANTSSIQLTGNVTVNTATNAIIGNGTTFQTLVPGQIIFAAGDSQAIVSIANSTYLTVGTPWSANATGANVFLNSTGGVSYLNNSNSIFTTFNRFQIKVILQSNNSAQVPLLQDLRALAMQL